jgi:hypothetical protein
MVYHLCVDTLYEKMVIIRFTYNCKPYVLLNCKFPQKNKSQHIVMFDTIVSIIDTLKQESNQPHIIIGGDFNINGGFRYIKNDSLRNHKFFYMVRHCYYYYNNDLDYIIYLQFNDKTDRYDSIHNNKYNLLFMFSFPQMWDILRDIIEIKTNSNILTHLIQCIINIENLTDIIKLSEFNNISSVLLYKIKVFNTLDTTHYNVVKRIILLYIYIILIYNSTIISDLISIYTDIINILKYLKPYMPIHTMTIYQSIIDIDLLTNIESDKLTVLSNLKLIFVILIIIYDCFINNYTITDNDIKQLNMKQQTGKK